MAAEILRECANWLRQQNNIQNVSMTSGGWEKWAQIDFSGYLRGKSHRVIANDTCFTDATKTNDFTVYGVACVDLKTHGYRTQSPESMQTYRTKVQAAKAEMERLRLNNCNKDNEKFCVGISNQDDMIAGLRTLYNKNTIGAGDFMKYTRSYFGPDFEHAVVASASGAKWVVSFCKVD